MKRLREFRKSLLALCAAVAIIIGWVSLRPDANALLSIETKCIAALRESKSVFPCVMVDAERGFVVIKDRKGDTHYLLLPITAITGIESKAILDRLAPNYFALAWANRSIVEAERTPLIADQEILLAINSKFGRSQNQLHIHLSCIRPDIRNRLDQVDNGISDNWAAIPGGLAKHEYWARHITRAEFDNPGAFNLVAFGLVPDQADMAKFSIAVAVAKNGGFVLLATKRDLFDLNLASSEELQDEDCTSPHIARPLQ